MKKKPSIIFVANYLPDQQQSMIRASILYKDIMEEAGYHCETIRPKERIGKLRRFLPSLSKWLNYIDKYIIFPIELGLYSSKKIKAEEHIYHIIDHSNSMYCLCLTNQAKLITCHDVIAIKSMLGRNAGQRVKFTGRCLQKIILFSLKSTKRIVCVSEGTKNELKKLVENEEHKITTAYQPLNYDYKPIEKDKSLKIIEEIDVIKKIKGDCKFILHVGGNQWYKNRTGVCRIYKEISKLREELNQAKITLVLAGKTPTNELIKFRDNNRELNIIFVENPTNRQVNALYSSAALLLFPSLKEGFGWPIIEAMASGCPVVTTRMKPMTEAGGKAATYIDPSDIKTAAITTNNVLEWNVEIRKGQEVLGYKHAEIFSRKQFAQKYEAAYEEAVIIKHETGK